MAGCHILRLPQGVTSAGQKEDTLADTTTVYLPGRWPVTVDLDEWECLGESEEDDDCRSPDPGKRNQALCSGEGTEYAIKMYRKDGRYLVTGIRTGRDDGHETGRLVEAHDDAVEAIWQVSYELCDAAHNALRRRLGARIIFGLTPVPLD